MRQLLRKGNLADVTQSIAANVSKYLGTIINNEEYELILETERAARKVIAKPVHINFTTFESNNYRCRFSVPIQNAYQLPKPVRGEVKLEIKKCKPRPSETLAKHEACAAVMKSFLSDDAYREELSWYASDVDLLFGYCNKHGYSPPQIQAYRTQDKPCKSTAIVRSELIKGEGKVSLQGEEMPRYGAALYSTCQALQKFIVDFKLLPASLV